MKDYSEFEKNILADREHTVCFTGHRPSKLPDAKALSFTSELEHAILSRIQQGKKIFINGYMAGFDILAGEMVLKQRQLHPHILCITIAPFHIGYFDNDNWNEHWKKRAIEVYYASDMAFSLEEKYRRGIYYARNDFMLEHASDVVCYYKGLITDIRGHRKKGGGTEYTIKKAMDLGLEIQNIYK